jgi:plastocyanin
MSAVIRLSLVIAVACVGLLPADRAAAAPRKPATHTVTMEAVTFQPADLTVSIGDKVVWSNQDPFPHTVTSKAVAFDSKAIAAGKAWTYRAMKRGDFAYLCTLHPTMGGTIHVK